MNVFLKAAAGVLTALILWLSLNKHNKENAAMLTLAVCAMVITAGIAFLQPVVDFMQSLREIGTLNDDLFSVILKAVGIGLIAEVCTLVCKDAGNESIGKALQILSTVMVLWLSIPVFEQLLSLLDKILGKL